MPRSDNIFPLVFFLKQCNVKWRCLICSVKRVVWAGNRKARSEAASPVLARNKVLKQSSSYVVSYGNCVTEVQVTPIKGKMCPLFSRFRKALHLAYYA